MYPDQPQPQQPYTPPPSPGGHPPQYGPTQPYQQPLQQPQAQNYSPMAPPQYPAQPQQSQAPANWYTPTPPPNSDRPASADQYIQQATGQSQQNMQNPATGQTIKGQYAVDYLGGIAPQSPTNTVSIGGFQLTKKMLLFIGGGAAALILAVVLLFASQKPADPNMLNEASLYTSYIDTAEITKHSKKYLNSSHLRATNGSLQTFLINSATQMETPMAKSGIDHKKLKTAAKKPPYHDVKMAEKLEDARLNAIYDRVYAQQVGYKLEIMMATLQKVKKINTRKSMQEYIKQVEPSLKTLQEAIKKYNDNEAT